MRRAFTLIEFLVAVTIIAILASLVLWGVGRAQETSKIERTKATVAKIHRVIAGLWDEYKTRRLPLPPLVSLRQFHQGGDLALPLIPDYPIQARRLKINAKRDLIRLEMPDRWSDVIEPQPPATLPLVLVYPLVHPRWRLGRTATYYGHYKVALSRGATQEQINAWANSELLFLIVRYGNTEAVRFQSWEVGDIDGDGLKEFWDAWGLPIAWRRWPAGFLPDLGVIDTVQSRDKRPADDSEMLAGDGWQVYPLVFSAGPDGLYDINLGTQPNASGDPEVYRYRLDADGNVNPCQTDLHESSPGTLDPLLIGQPYDSTGPLGEKANGRLDHHDNIHNHSLLGINDSN